MSKDELLSALKASELLKESEKSFDDTETKINLFKTRIEKIRKKLKESKHKFSKSRINKINKNLHEMEKTEKNLLESEKKKNSIKKVL